MFELESTLEVKNLLLEEQILPFKSSPLLQTQKAKKKSSCPSGIIPIHINTVYKRYLGSAELLHFHFRL